MTDFKFEIAERPEPGRETGSVASHTQAVLDTAESGKAIKFSDSLTARKVCSNVGRVILRRKLPLRCRVNMDRVWCEKVDL